MILNFGFIYLALLFKNVHILEWDYFELFNAFEKSEISESFRGICNLIICFQLFSQYVWTSSFKLSRLITNLSSSLFSFVY